MVAKLKPDVEALADDFYSIEEWPTMRLHEVHDTYGIEALCDAADRLNHSIDCDLEITARRRRSWAP
jgi:hypothetical protein